MKQEDLKFDQGKPRYSLVPAYALEAVAQVLTFGAEKYAAESWREITDTDRYLDALMRHVEAIRKGEIYDQESGLQHMAHVATNAMFLFEFQLENEKDQK